MVRCTTYHGLVVELLDYSSITKSIGWVCYSLPLCCITNDLYCSGHCWADTEPNISQLTVPQGVAPIQASTIMMGFFDSMTS
jgi:hypothetical protein